MADRFENHSASLSGPATHGFEITPNDGSDLAETTRAIFVGVSGDITVVLVSGANLTFSGVIGGTVLPIRVQAVKSTGTTAANLLGLL